MLNIRMTHQKSEFETSSICRMSQSIYLTYLSPTDDIYVRTWWIYICMCSIVSVKIAYKLLFVLNKEIGILFYLNLLNYAINFY